MACNSIDLSLTFMCNNSLWLVDLFLFDQIMYTQKQRKYIDTIYGSTEDKDINLN